MVFDNKQREIQYIPHKFVQSKSCGKISPKQFLVQNFHLTRYNSSLKPHCLLNIHNSKNTVLMLMSEHIDKSFLLQTSSISPEQFDAMVFIQLNFAKRNILKRFCVLNLMEYKLPEKMRTCKEARRKTRCFDVGELQAFFAFLLIRR